MPFHKTFALRCAAVFLFLFMIGRLFYMVIKESEDDDDPSINSLPTPSSPSPSSHKPKFARDLRRQEKFFMEDTPPPRPAKKKICDHVTPKRHMIQRGRYWVIQNHVMASKKFACDQSITYTTHADFTYLDNLEPLIERWRGPISIALYAPAKDFVSTMRHINYVRECTKMQKMIRELVTFHLFFEAEFMPPKIFPVGNASSFKKSQNFCKTTANFSWIAKRSFRKAKGLLYPVNVARNIAKQASQTWYVLASDIELYPGPVPDLIPQFLNMINRNEFKELWGGEGRGNSKVFVLPVFEIHGNVSVRDLPKNKMQLLKMLGDGRAVPFHRNLCHECHAIPEPSKWLNRKGNWTKSKRLGISHVGKRVKSTRNWEPFYIGTREDPAWDDRLSWEGRSNKMTQAFSLCLLNYDFLILDKAFLVHRPGIARRKAYDLTLVAQQDRMIKEKIKVELQTLYGHRRGCQLLNTP